MGNNLNEAQFKEFPIEQVLKMHSRDAPSYGKTYVGEILDEKRKDSHYESVKQKASERGQLPIDINRNRQGYLQVADGHHRIAVEQDLGHKTIKARVEDY